MRPHASHQPAGLAEAAAGFSGRTACCTPFRAAASARRGPRVRREATVVRADQSAQSSSGDAAAAAALAAATTDLQQQQQEQRQAPDPYQMAGQRLRGLLGGVGSGEVR